jgi:hypothetical protein
MKTGALLLVLMVLLGVTACAGPFSKKLSYANVQSLNPGLEASWILEEFPFGQVTRTADDRVESIVYNVTDPHGKNQTLYLGFDERGILRDKRYSGRVLMPGSSYANN